MSFRKLLKLKCFGIHLCAVSVQKKIRIIKKKIKMRYEPCSYSHDITIIKIIFFLQWKAKEDILKNAL